MWWLVSRGSSLFTVWLLHLWNRPWIGKGCLLCLRCCSRCTSGSMLPSWSSWANLILGLVQRSWSALWRRQQKDLLPGARRRIHPKLPKSEYWLAGTWVSHLLSCSSEEGHWINWNSESDCRAELFLLNLLSLLSSLWHWLVLSYLQGWVLGRSQPLPPAPVNKALSCAEHSKILCFTFSPYPRLQRGDLWGPMYGPFSGVPVRLFPQCREPRSDLGAVSSVAWGLTTLPWHSCLGARHLLLWCFCLAAPFNPSRLWGPTWLRTTQDPAEKPASRPDPKNYLFMAVGSHMTCASSEQCSTLHKQCFLYVWERWAPGW